MVSYTDPVEVRMKDNALGKFGEDMAIKYFIESGFSFKKVGVDKRKTNCNLIDSAKPDFLVKDEMLVEAKLGASGRSEDDINEGRSYPHCKIKLHSIKAYTEWNKIKPVYVIIHWSNERRIVKLFDLIDLIELNDYPIHIYSNNPEWNKEYYAIPKEHIDEKNLYSL